MGIKSIWERNSLYLENDFLKIKEERKNVLRRQMNVATLRQTKTK